MWLNWLIVSSISLLTLWLLLYHCISSCLPGCSMVKNLPANAGDAGDQGSIPRSGRSPGVGYGNSLQCSCLENSMDSRAWLDAVHGVTKNQTGLRDWAHTNAHIISVNEKEVLTFPTTFVNFSFLYLFLLFLYSVFFYISANFCFVYFEYLLWDTYTLRFVMCS